MTETKHFTTLSLKMSTHERIRKEADATGMKIWALVDCMAEKYFSQRGNV